MDRLCINNPEAFKYKRKTLTKPFGTKDESLREVKLVFATLGENLNVARKPKTVVKESLASKPTTSTAPSKSIISEGNVVADRFKKLAGLIK